MKKDKKTKSSNLKPLEISVQNFNAKRGDIIGEYLTVASKENTISDDSFSVSVTPISKNKSVISIKNNSAYYFTGDITVHESAVLSFHCLAPARSENITVDRKLESGDNDFKLKGDFYELKQQLISFPIREEYIGKDCLQAFITVDSFGIDQQKELAKYYYILDTLYNFSSTTEYRIYNEAGDTMYGTLVVDTLNQTATYSENDNVVFTETY